MFKAACLIVLMFLSVRATAQEQAKDVARQLANAYGLEQWDQIQEIHFTFNSSRKDGSTTSRAWSWQPGTGQVTRTVDSETATINEKQVNEQSPDEDRRVHRQFINDTYWFLMPFQAVWSQPQLTLEEDAASPVEGEDRRYAKLTTAYPSGGYTPGDAYDLYLDTSADAQPNPKLVYWVFRRGAKEGGNPVAWDSQQQLGPIIVILERRRPGAERASPYFTDVRATLVDGREVSPEPISSEADGVESR